MNRWESMSWGSWNIALPSGRCLGYVWLRNWLSVQWTSMLRPEMIETIFVLSFTGHYWGWRGRSENCFLLGLPLGSGCWCRSHLLISSQPFLKQECLYMFKVAPLWNKRLEFLIAKCRAHPRKCSKGFAAHLNIQLLSLVKHLQIVFFWNWFCWHMDLCFSWLSLLPVLMIWWYGYWHWMREWLA